MSKLLYAQFSRLFKNKLFYIFSIIIAAIAFILSLPGSIMYLQLYDFYANIDIVTLFSIDEFIGPFQHDTKDFFLNISYDDFKDYLEFSHTIFFELDYNLTASFYIYGIIAAILISMLIGKDFSDGTIRNKIISGSSRTSVYLSNLIVCVTAEVIMQIIHIIATLLPMFIVFIRYLGTGQSCKFFALSFKEHVVLQLVGLGIITFYSALFIFLTMTFSSRSRAVTASILTVFILIISSMSINQTLYSNEYFYMDDNLETIDSANHSSYDYWNDYENPNDYKEVIRGKNLKEPLKTIYCFFDDFLPTCQAYNIFETENVPTTFLKYIVYDFSFSVLITAMGLIIFNRKDLK